MPFLKYNGPCPRVQVAGFGHFAPGDVKAVDIQTAASMSHPDCQREGWEVIPDAVEEPPTHEAPVAASTNTFENEE